MEGSDEERREHAEERAEGGCSETDERGRMGTSEALSELLGKKTRANLSNGHAIEGTLQRADEIGALFTPDRLLKPTVVGPAEAQKPEESVPACCFIAWSQIQMIIPSPGEAG